MKKRYFIFIILFSLNINATNHHQLSTAQQYHRTTFQNVISTMSIKIGALSGGLYGNDIQESDKSEMRSLQQECRKIAQTKRSRQATTQGEKLTLENTLAWLNYYKIKPGRGSSWEAQLEK